MVRIFFSGGASMDFPPELSGEEVQEMLTSQGGLISHEWVTIQGPGRKVHINPTQVAYITDE